MHAVQFQNRTMTLEKLSLDTNLASPVLCKPKSWWLVRCQLGNNLLTVVHRRNIAAAASDIRSTKRRYDCGLLTLIGSYFANVQSPSHLQTVLSSGGAAEMSVTLQSVIRLRIHALFFLAIVLVLAGCGGNEPADVVTPEVTAAAGGMALPAEPVTATVNSGAEAAPATPLPAPGEQLRPLSSGLRLYVDASRQAPVMNQYAAEASFTLLTPSGDYSAYPVELAGEQWYRLRAEDGLVGWAPAAMLTTLP